jgi:hypothetical protein
MKYSVTKRRYLDSFFILIIGIVSIVALGFYMKVPLVKKDPLAKPTVSIAAANRFLYIANDDQHETAAVFTADTLKNDVIYSTASAQNSVTASLFYNHFLYLHGNENVGINIDTKKFFENKGDYISPDGKKYLSLENRDASGGLLIFSLLDEHNVRSSIKTPQTMRQVDTLLGWSPDSNNFYYTVSYSITKEASKSATDQWMQKVSKTSDEMVPMSRVRTWVEYSTSSAERIFQVNMQDKSVSKMFADTDIGVIHRAFYNNKADEFYLENDSGLYRLHSTDTNITPVALAPKIATAASSLVFSPDTNSFVHSDGTSINVADPDKNTDSTIFYASQSAKVTPLAFTGNKVLFSVLDTNYLSGEIIDSKRLIRTEFFHTPIDPTIATSSPSLFFVSWLKDVSIKF